MKIKNREISNREIKITICLTILALIAMGAIFAGFRSNSHPLNVISDDGSQAIEIREGGELPAPEIISPITDYFKINGDALSQLHTTDITALFFDPNSKNALLNQGTLDYLIKLRLKQRNDLRMMNYKCELDFSGVNEDGDDLDVYVTEYNTVNFAFIPDVESSNSGIQHVFKLRKEGEAYVIVEHTKDEDSFNMLQEATSDDSVNLNEVLDQKLNAAFAAVEEITAENKTFNSEEPSTREPFSGNRYDAVAAVNYAMTWVDAKSTVRNEAQFGVYDNYGGNCNNYISQCLNAGGIPMDFIGDEHTQWKWYSDEINLDEIDAGRSPAWAGVDEFHTYAQQNTGFGLYAVVDDNVFSGSAGDILQFGHDGTWVHSVIITKVIKDKNGKVLDYLINSNTTDRINYPASAYGYPEMRLIKILGWNESSIDN